MPQDVGAYTVQFSYDALLNGYWLPTFYDLAKKYGVGLVCENEVGGVVTYFPDQEGDFLVELENFATTTGLPYVVFGRDGVPTTDTAMTIYEDGGNTLGACNTLKSEDPKYTCHNEDYCGENAAADSLHQNTDSDATSSSSSGSSSDSNSSSLSGPNSGSNAASGSGSNSAASSAPSSSSIATSSSSSSSSSNSESIASSTLASTPETNQVSTPKGDRWLGYNLNSTMGSEYPDTVTKKEPLSTTLITITSCSEHVCSEIIQTTAVTTVINEHTTYTTFCPLTAMPSDSTHTLVPSTTKGKSLISGMTSSITFSASSGVSSTASSGESSVVPSVVPSGSVSSTASSTGSSTMQAVVDENGAWKVDYSRNAVIVGAALLLL